MACPELFFDWGTVPQLAPPNGLRYTFLLAFVRWCTPVHERALDRSLDRVDNGK